MAMKKVVTLMGMSGVGKSYTSFRLAEWGWYHYSCDPEIGCNILKDEIIETIQKDIMAHAQLRAYLESGAITVNNNIKPENIATLSAYVGKIGNPVQGRLGNHAHGGYSLEEFRRRQRKYYEAECQVLMNLKDRIPQAEAEGYEYFINDSTGSMCEIEDEEVLDFVGQNSLIVYIKATPEEEQEVVRRSLEYPKPLFYPPGQFDEWLSTYLQENNYSRPREMEPDEFARWVFPKLFAARLPKYQRIADQYGITVSSADLRAVQSEDDFLALIER